MCLGIPGRVVEVLGGDNLLRTARVDFGGVRKDVCLAYVPQAGPGDYVIVHVGFAISQVDEAEARRTLEVLRAMDDVLTTELGVTPTGPPSARRPVAGRPAEPAS